ncbi:helix-turn-helix domain-containing protein [Paenibacillus silvae]|uniref:helix-turn-helix domain-containing protein n=2 Tax=Paenibacillus silvae TaxID=1325358 RepID=UPI002003A72A|nr:helix-turn-helix domain-containing protein [Paenibacillus silvae]MCK6076682.1 ABC transporter substrate-binding protein [Paenibacillus silvae]
MLDIHPDMLAQCIDIMDLTNVLCEHPRLQLEHTSLLLVTDGQATLSMNGREEHMVYGHVIVVEKGSVIQLTDTYHMDFSGYFISFRMYDIQTNTPCMYSVNTQAGYAVQKIPETVLSDTRIAIHKAAAADELSVTMKQFILYNLLKELKEERRPEEFTLEERLARTLVHMQQKYNQSINREELAAIAGYSPAYYSRQFMQLYGKTPMEYLIRYRIFRAQEMLLTTGDLSKNVAKKTGFDDAQYFNRQFKRFVGKAPKQFMQSIADYRICFLSAAHAEIAIGLGVIPHGVTVISSLTPKYQQDMFKHYGVSLIEMPQYVFQPDRIAQIQPDLIIGEHLTEETKQQLRAVAPVITNLPPDLNSLIHYFGHLLNRQKQASQLIQELEERVDTLKDKIDSHIKGEPTVLYLRVEESGYRYVGESSCDTAILLHKELGLPIPETFRTNERSFNICSLQQLAEANPAYLFVEKRIMDYYSAGLSLVNLQGSEQWGFLDAVTNNRVFYVDTGLWINNCSVFGKRKIMQQIEQAMLGS